MKETDKILEGSSTHVHMQWHHRFPQQFRALFWKNVLVAMRNWKATFVRLAAPFIFLLLVLLIDVALQANEEAVEDTKVRRSPGTEAIKDIPPCEDDLYIRGNCISFLYSVTASDGVSKEAAEVAVRNIVDIVRTHNDPVIHEDHVMPMDGKEEINNWLLENPDRALGAVHFYVSNELKWIDYSLQTNSTVKYFKNRFQDPNFFFQVPLQNAVQRAIAVHQLMVTNGIQSSKEITWTMGYKDYPHPAFSTETAAGFLLGPFLFAANMFGVVTQMNAMVSEKQSGLKQSLRTMGMMDSAYWTSWAVWEIALNFFTSLLNVAFGSLFQFRFFLKNDFILVFLLMFLFQLSMVSIGFIIAALINKVVLATMLGFIIFVMGWMTFTVLQFGIPYTSEYFDRYMWVTVPMTMLPWNIFMKAVDDLSEAAANSESKGLSFSRRISYCRDTDNDIQCENEAAATNEYIDCECVMPLGDIFWILIVLSLGYTIVAAYIDKVIPNEFGVCLHPLFFLDPRYWGYDILLFSRRGRVRTLSVDQGVRREIDEDVEAEMRKIQKSVDSNGVAQSQHHPVELFGLQKRFGRKFFAIKNSWLNIDEGELFCLLGPNGAGKTTTINCLTGVLPPSGGTAYVYGNSINEAGGMEKIRSMMGVCPQFDLLWKLLTGKEHLWIFGLVKGIPYEHVDAQSTALLEKVALTNASNQRAGTYSGGMKRRLSVAIALLGDPKIVFLDEPTTGMDPISRRYVWDIIQSTKPGRAIVLTTHSMEEADILGDRICIMARGDIRALGANIRLKQKFGAGYSISVSVKSRSTERRSMERPSGAKNGDGNEIKTFFMDRLGIHPREENRAYITFLIPREKETQLSQFLEELEANQERLAIGDIHLSLTTLEEVFLNIARSAEIEALNAKGTSEMLIPFTNGTSIKIKIGQEQFVHPDTKITYLVQWGQNDAGDVQIADAVPVGEVPEGAPEPDLSLID